jgi:NRPS condensation-like uncharacterized protein
MIEWTDMHPYNAIHVVRIPEVLDPKRLSNIVKGAMRSKGLTRVTLNRKKGTFHYDGDSALCEIRTIPAEEGAGPALGAEIEQQLNTGFVQNEPFNPFRFFVVPEGDGFFLGLAYFHAVADAESVVLLLKDMVDAYRAKNQPQPFSPVDLYARRYDGYLRRHPGLLAKRLCTLPGLVRGLRHSCRPPLRDPQNLNNGFRFFSLAPHDLSCLIEAGKSSGVTLNDLFLALLLKALSPLAADRVRARRRRKISVGSIVNIRKDLGVDSARTFGLFLGGFVVTHAVPEGISVIDLAKDIRGQTCRIKEGRHYLATPLQLAFARFMLSFFPAERRKTFYQKYHPLWGGITNINLNSLWSEQNEARPIDYFRAVSTGPVTPLVLSVTTVRDHVNIGLTYRTAIFSAQEIEEVQAHFLDALKQQQGHS